MRQTRTATKTTNARKTLTPARTQSRVYDIAPKPVVKYSLTGEAVAIYKSIAMTKKDGFDTSTISKCAKGKREQHNGYRWAYLPKSATAKISLIKADVIVPKKHKITLPKLA